MDSDPEEPGFIERKLPRIIAELRAQAERFRVADEAGRGAKALRVKTGVGVGSATSANADGLEF